MARVCAVVFLALVVLPVNVKAFFFFSSCRRHPASLAARPDNSGPRREAETSRPSRQRPNQRRQRPRSDSSRSSSSPPVSTKKRAPHQFDHTLEEARPFINALTEVQVQNPNETAPSYDLEGLDDLVCLSSSSQSEQQQKEGQQQQQRPVIAHNHFETYALDDLFPNLGFSELFATSKTFRQALRSAVREDVFDTTPAYSKMSEKARKMLLLPDSSLQGTWRCNSDSSNNNNNNNSPGTTEGTSLRMKRLTNVLQEYLGTKSQQAPTGDEFMETIGSLCGSRPSTHWMDIVGISTRKVPHSWHQDTGRLANNDVKTVMLGFPRDDEYDGVGVFSHAIKLKREQWAPDHHPPNVPLVYQGTVPAEYIVRPRFAMGREILAYRDVDILHSAPDVTYRESLLRFM